MNGNTTKNEFSKDLIATRSPNVEPVTLTLTAIEIFAIVSTIQIAKVAISEPGSIGECAKGAAKKMHDHLDPNSLLSLQLNEGWELEGVSSDD
jgi:hypothetical protein